MTIIRSLILALGVIALAACSSSKNQQPVQTAPMNTGYPAYGGSYVPSK